MSATDELRRLLDERGMGYDVRDGEAIKNTYWDDTDGRRWGYASDESGVFNDRQLFLIHGRMDLTPEQAIAATLGDDAKPTQVESSETCTADETNTWECVCDGIGHYGKRLTVHVMECSECGHTYEHVNGMYEFCPHCGRRVVDE